MFAKYFPGDQLVVNTRTDKILGSYVTHNKSCIVIKNTRISGTNPGPCQLITLYTNEIQSIQKVETEESSSIVENNDAVVESKETCLQVDEEIVSKVNFVLLEKKDQKYYDAVEDLKTYEFVGLIAENTKHGRKSKIHTVLMSTPFQIYVFDIVSLKECKELQVILESNSPQKIVHDCRFLSDGLKHGLDVQLKSVFDLQVGDLYLQKTNNLKASPKPQSLSECIAKYLKLSGVKIDKEEPNVRLETVRPLPVDYVTSLASEISYFHKLSTCINDALLHRFNLGCDYFLTIVRDQDDIVDNDDECIRNDKVPSKMERYLNTTAFDDAEVVIAPTI